MKKVKWPERANPDLDPIIEFYAEFFPMKKFYADFQNSIGWLKSR